MSVLKVAEYLTEVPFRILNKYSSKYYLNFKTKFVSEGSFKL